MTEYFRAIPQTDVARPDHALALAGGWTWFTHVERLARGQAPEILLASDIPAQKLAVLSASRPRLGRLEMDRPQIMGILNVTPDSFSDGGIHDNVDLALKHGAAMLGDGATMIDVGGESTRPGATDVSIDDEIVRTAPAIRAITQHHNAMLSIDTRKAAVAEAALQAGANLVNDVSGFTFDPALAPLCAKHGVPVCVMHAQGDPATMQSDPQYGDVLLDVYDFLDRQVSALVGLGIPRSQIAVDPGIGFGKTQAHNLVLLARLSLFHGLGCPILLGASRKRFIGTIGNAPDAQGRAPGSVAVALEAIAQGVQIVRVHDVAETRQALSLWQAVTKGIVDDA